MLEKLTPQQEKALQFIRDRSQKSGMAPTLRELGAFMGYKAVGSAQDIVAALRRKGFLKEADRRIARNLLVTNKGRAYAERGFPLEPQMEPLAGYIVPCLGSVPAGNPLEAIEARVGTLHLSPSLFHFPAPPADRLFALRARGQSMIQAGILDGDWLVVVSQEEAESENIVVARVDGDVTVKRLHHDNKRGWALHPANPDFHPIFADQQPFTVVGKVVALQRMVAP